MQRVRGDLRAVVGLRVGDCCWAGTEKKLLYCTKLEYNNTNNKFDCRGFCGAHVDGKGKREGVGLSKWVKREGGR